MTLTPEDVLNKTFTQTQFRRGYDEREVDDFLDDIVAEMRRMAKESNELRAELASARESTGSFMLTTSGVPGAEASSRELDELRAANAALTAQVSQLEAARFETGGAQSYAVTELNNQLTSARARIAELEAANRDLDATRRTLEVRAADLEARLAAAPVQAAPSPYPNDLGAAPMGASTQDLDRLRARIAEAELDAQGRITAANERAERAEREARERISTAQAQAATAAAYQAPTTASSAFDLQGALGGVGDPTGVLALAQRLHDEHVQAGEARGNELVDAAQSKYDELVMAAQRKHDQLIGSAQARHDELLATARAQHDEMVAKASSEAQTMVAEAQQRKARVLDDLERQQGTLERKIEELRGFERDYRSRLRAFIEGQLADLKNVAVDSVTRERESAQFH